MPPVGFDSAISAGERPQTYALDRAATGTGELQHLLTIIYLNNVSRRGQAYCFGIKINNNLPFEIKKKLSHIVKTILIGITHLKSLYILDKYFNSAKF
jgi:hypothetical protein